MSISYRKNVSNSANLLRLNNTLGKVRESNELLRLVFSILRGVDFLIEPVRGRETSRLGLRKTLLHHTADLLLHLNEDMR